MGLRLIGPVRHIESNQHLEVQVRYHSPIAMLTGTLDEAQPVIGGQMGMRYIVKGGTLPNTIATTAPWQAIASP